MADEVRRDLVMVQVVELRAGREITYASTLAEQVRDRIDDIRDAIVTGARAVASSLPELAPPSDWSLEEVEASFGLTLTAEAGVILSKASASAAFDVKVKFRHQPANR